MTSYYDPVTLEEAMREIRALRKVEARYMWLKQRAVQNTAWDLYGDGGNWIIGFFSKDSRLSIDAVIDAELSRKKC